MECTCKLLSPSDEVMIFFMLLFISSDLPPTLFPDFSISSCRVAICSKGLSERRTEHSDPPPAKCDRLKQDNGTTSFTFQFLNLVHQSDEVLDLYSGSGV